MKVKTGVYVCILGMWYNACHKRVGSNEDIFLVLCLKSVCME